MPPGSEAAAEFVVSRVIAAPIERVWRAWSDPKLVRQWWGPAGFSCPIARMNFVEGGSSLVCMRSVMEGHEIYNTWTYRTIRPMERIEFDSRFADREGSPLEPAAMGLPAGIPDPVPHEVTLHAEPGGRTTLTVVEHGYSAGPVLEMSRKGQEQCLDKLAAAVASDEA